MNSLASISLTSPRLQRLTTYIETDPCRKPDWRHRMIELLQQTVAWMMNHVRVNQMQRTIRDGVPVVVKRRRFGGSLMIWFANRFLALADSGICMFERADVWLNWEVHCSRLLYPDRPAVTLGPGHAVNMTEVPGVSLRQMLHRGQTNLKAFVAAAREIRRVHQIQCGIYKAAWSHGDLHLDNILYDSGGDRAVLIDFDTRHELTINSTRRHVDDLKVVLLELLAMPEEQWRQPATVFLEEYADSSVLHELSRQLFVPRGFAKILWYARTNCCSIRKLEPRIQSLRQIVLQVAATTIHATRAAGDRHESGGEQE
ncbi:MAG: hypothetical protein H7Z17_17125 [Fuerstia sp.]|nr:hypothetical protein [Fuerstiella sp.]